MKDRKEYYKQYRELNKEKIKEYQKEYHKTYHAERRKNDSEYRIIQNIRNRTRQAITQYTLLKNTPTRKMLGCDKNTLLEWLQKSGEQYDPNFNIETYDANLYHIDHIKTFADVKEGIYTLEEVCHYTNLQILPAELNLSKGGNSW